MEVISKSDEMIFRKDYNGRPVYSIGLSKKDKDGKYVNGYMTCNFKQGTELENQSKIKIKDAWISFYLKDKQTIPTLFINDFEKVSEPNPEHKEVQEMVNDEHYKTKIDTFEQVEINPSDLPF